MKTYFANPKESFLKKKKEISKALISVIDNGNYILGENVSLFEKEFSNFLSANKGFFISCASGTDAITLALLAYDFPKDSKVIMPSHTAPASVIGVLNAGCIPIYVDTDPADLLLSIKEIKKVIKKNNVKAILAVHLYGNGVNIRGIKNILGSRNIKIIEDCAQSAGTIIDGKQSGTLANAGCFSFFPTKNLAALGDGGGIWVPTKTLKDRLVSLRQYGWDSKRKVNISKGINSRLDELQASILRIKLRDLINDVNKRRKIAKIYSNNLKDSYKQTYLPDFQKSSYHLYVVRTKKRNKLIAYMKDRGIILGVHYDPPNHKNGLLSRYSKNNLPITEKIAKEVISLPIYPELKKKHQLLIIKYLNEFK